MGFPQAIFVERQYRTLANSATGSKISPSRPQVVWCWFFGGHFYDGYRRFPSGKRLHNMENHRFNGQII